MQQSCFKQRGEKINKNENRQNRPRRLRIRKCDQTIRKKLAFLQTHNQKQIPDLVQWFSTQWVVKELTVPLEVCVLEANKRKKAYA